MERRQCGEEAMWRGGNVENTILFTAIREGGNVEKIFLFIRKVAHNTDEVSIMYVCKLRRYLYSPCTDPCSTSRTYINPTTVVA